jgi:hypothetical protein
MAAAAPLLALSVRPRTVTFEPATGVITVCWGVRWPVILARHEPGDWTALSLEQRSPVGVVLLGSGSVRAKALPPYWRLRGTTATGRQVVVADCDDQGTADQLRRELLARRGPG